MAMRCKNITQLKFYMDNKLSFELDTSSLGKNIYRFGTGLICTIFTNGTVQFQGANDEETMNKIATMINCINELENI